MDTSGSQRISASIGDLTNILQGIGRSGRLDEPEEQRLNELAFTLPFENDSFMKTARSYTVPGSQEYVLIDPDLTGGDDAEMLRTLRNQIDQSPWEPPSELADALNLYPWRTQVSSQTVELYGIWKAEGHVSEPLLDLVSGEDIVTMVEGEKQQALRALDYNTTWVWGKIDDLIDFLSTSWHKLKRKIADIGLGKVVENIRDLLLALAGRVGASGGFSMELSSTGIAYQLHFHLDPAQGAVAGETT